MSTGTVADIPDEKLLERAVRCARDVTAPSRHKHPRWVAVSQAFALGSTYSHQLCRRFGLDPDEMVDRVSKLD
jgi:hypothetical protein